MLNKKLQMLHCTLPHCKQQDCLRALSKLPFQLSKPALQSHILLLQLRDLLLQLLMHLHRRIQAHLPANTAGQLATAFTDLSPNIWPLRRLQACTASNKTQCQIMHFVSHWLVLDLSINTTQTQLGEKGLLGPVTMMAN
jgi:hypothetical protein